MIEYKKVVREEVNTFLHRTGMSVTEFCKRCGLSTPTFYAVMDDSKEVDIMVSTLDKMLMTIETGAEPSPTSKSFMIFRDHPQSVAQNELVPPPEKPVSMPRSITPHDATPKLVYLTCTCPGCDASVVDRKDGARYCFICGTPFVLICGTCGRDNEVDNEFCGKCGHRLRPKETKKKPTQPARKTRR